MLGQADLTKLKKLAALKSIELVRDGMIVGLGTGSTSALAIDALGQKVSTGLNILCIPTSEQTAQQAKGLGITLTDFAHHPQIDITIDGADEVEIDTLNLIKGRGGALLHEKIVACTSKELVIIVDESKLVERLGSKVALPLEVVRFGWEITQQRLQSLGTEVKLRLDGNQRPYCTDSGNYILDFKFSAHNNATELADQLKSIVGVIDTGFFINLASTVIVAKQTGIEILKAKR